MLAADCQCSHCRAAAELDAGRPVLLYTRSDLAALVSSGALAGRAVYLDVLHDDDCPMQPCGCSPWFALRSLALSPDRRAAS